MAQTYDSPQLNTLLGGTSAGGAPKPAPAPTASKTSYDSPKLSALLSGGVPKADTTVKTLVQNTPAPKDTSSLFSKSAKLFGSIISLPSKAIHAAGDALESTFGKNIETGLAMSDETGAEKVLKPAAALVGGSSPENLPLGVGDVIKGYKDIYHHPEDYAPVTFEDFLTGLAETGKQIDRGLIKMPLNFALKPVSFNVPYLGKISNREFDAAERIRNGEDPIAVGASEGIGSVFDTLMLAGMISEVAGPRQVVTNSATMSPEEVLNNPAIRNAPSGAKSFRLFDPVSQAQPVSPAMVERMITEKGFDPGKTYDSKLPTFFRGTSQSNGSIKFEVVQIKPSILNSISDYFSKNTSAGYANTQNALLSSGHDFDRAIESGDMPVEKVYNPNGTLQPHELNHTVSDLAGKLDEYKPGLGAQFKKGVDLSNPTPTSLINQASALLTKVAAGNTGLNNPLYLPSLSNKTINSIPRKDVIVLKTKTIDPKEIIKAKNQAPQPKVIHPTLAKEITDHVATHGPEITHQALQDKLGIPSKQATEIMKMVIEDEAHNNPAKSPSAILNKIINPPTIPDHIPNEGLPFENEKLNEILKPETGGEKITPANEKIEKTVSTVQSASPKVQYQIADQRFPTVAEAIKYQNTLQLRNRDNIGSAVAGKGGQVDTTIREIRIHKKPKKLALSPKAQEHISYHHDAISMLKEQLDNHPGKVAQKFNSKKEGQFEDFKNPDRAKTPAAAERIRARNAKVMKAIENAADSTKYSDHFDDVDKIREAIEEYKNMQESLQYHKEQMANAKNEIFPEENALTKIIESTPESKKIAEGFSTNFEYNPESGFATIEPIAKVINNVEEFLKATNKGTKAAANLDDSLYILTKANEADRILAVKLTKKIDISIEDAEAIYHYEEDKSLPLTDHQRQVYEDSIKPLADASSKIAHKLKEIIPVDAEGYTPRFVKGRGNVIDRIKKGAQGIGGKGSVLGKNAPSLKRRTMKAIIDAEGNRIIVSLKDGKITKMGGGEKKIIGYYSSARDLSSGKYYKNIKDLIAKKPAPDTLNIQEATTKEIEATTNLTYHKNVFVNRIVSYLNLRQVERATDFLEAYKASPEFGSIGMKFGEGEAPKGWTTTVNPSFRGYMLDPKVANVMDKYASNMVKGKDPLRALTSLNAFLRTAIFFNPLIHIPNIGVHWLVNRGATKFVNPKAYVRLAKTSARAINAVIHQNQDYVDMLHSGAPLLYSSQNTRNMHNLLLGKMTAEIDKNPNLDFMKKILKSINPYVLSGKATWMINDIATMQAVYEEMAENPALTMEQAIKDVGAHIPNYRLPANKIVELLTNPNITMFGAYHYGALRSYVEMAKTLVTGATEGNIPYSENSKGEHTRSYFGKEANKNRRQILDKLLMLGIIALVIYPAIDRAIQKATKNPNAKLRRAGAVTFPYNLIQVASGQQDISQFIQSVMTPAVGSKEIISQAFNLDLFTGQHIRDTNATASQEFKEAAAHAIKAVAPVAQYQKLDTGAQTTRQFLLGLTGISDPNASKTKYANAVQSAQTKVDKLDKTTVARIRPIYEKAKAAGFGTPEADALLADFSSADMAIYKDLKAVDIAKDNIKLVDKITPIVNQAHELGFGTPEADKLVENFSTQEAKVYTDIKKTLYGADGKGGAPVYADGSVHEEKGFIGSIVTYGKAFGIDPVTAFERIFTGQTIRRLDNGTIIVDRNDKTEAAMKKRLGGTPAMTLDHLKSFEVGGDNAENNMWLISKDQALEDDKVENYLGNALRKGLITGKQAQEYEVRYKKGADAAFIDDRVRKTFEKVGAPLTLEEIKNLINQ